MEEPQLEKTQQPSSAHPRDAAHCTVVVVGAGFAGVGAARRLVQGGLRDVTILEAAERPGGRVQTVTLDEGFVELGAQFLHGESEVFHYAQSRGLLREDEDEKEEDRVPDTLLVYENTTFRFPDATALSSKIVSQNLKVMEDLLSTTRQLITSDVTVSMGDYFKQKYPEYMPLMAGEGKAKAAMLRWLDAWTLLDAAAKVDQLSLAGTARYQYQEGSGVTETRAGLWDVFSRMLQDTLQAQGTTSAAASPSSASSSSALTPSSSSSSSSSSSPQASPSGCRLLLNKAVKKVVWNDSSKLSITTSINNNNNNNNESEMKTYSSNSEETNNDLESKASPNRRESDRYVVSTGPPHHARVRIECEDGDVMTADHVIVTSSMGFLKEARGFFSPALPAKHRDAVDGMGFGDVAKVFLLWEKEQGGDSEVGCGACHPDDSAEDHWCRRVFGSEDVEGMALLWPGGQDDADGVEVKSARSPLRTSDGRPWYEDVCLIDFVSSYIPCVMCWVSGEGAIIMESLPVSEVKDVLYEIFIMFRGKCDLPPPARLIRSEWQTNPYTRGAYSYLATGVPLESQDVLSQPLPSPQDPVLQLAGEACSAQYYSTVHGALTSGQHAATTILRHHGMIQ